MERLKLETIENIIGLEKTTIEAFEKNGEIATFDKCILMGIEELKQYRIAEEQGLLLRLPVPEGAVVYTLSYIYECKFDYDCKEFDAYKCEEDIPCEHQYKVYRVKNIPVAGSFLKDADRQNKQLSLFDD